MEIKPLKIEKNSITFPQKEIRTIIEIEVGNPKQELTELVIEERKSLLKLLEESEDEYFKNLNNEIGDAIIELIDKSKDKEIQKDENFNSTIKKIRNRIVELSNKMVPINDNTAKIDFINSLIQLTTICENEGLKINNSIWKDIESSIFLSQIYYDKSKDEEFIKAEMAYAFKQIKMPKEIKRELLQFAFIKNHNLHLDDYYFRYILSKNRKRALKFIKPQFAINEILSLDNEKQYIPLSDLNCLEIYSVYKNIYLTKKYYGNFNLEPNESPIIVQNMIPVFDIENKILYYIPDNKDNILVSYKNKLYIETLKDDIK